MSQEFVESTRYPQWRKHLARRFARRGDKRRDHGSWPDAIQPYRAAVRLWPGFEAIWVQLGHANKEVGDYEEAQSAYLRALALNGENADTHLQLGHLLKLLDRPQEAEAAYRTAASLDPTCIGSQRELQFMRRVRLLPRTDGDIKPAAMPSGYRSAAAKPLASGELRLLVDRDGEHARGIADGAITFGNTDGAPYLIARSSESLHVNALVNDSMRGWCTICILVHATDDMAFTLACQGIGEQVPSSAQFALGRGELRWVTCVFMNTIPRPEFVVSSMSHGGSGLPFGGLRLLATAIYRNSHQGSWEIFLDDVANEYRHDIANISRAARYENNMRHLATKRTGSAGAGDPASAPPSLAGAS